MREKEILDFIARRWRIDAKWIDGNCYWFAYILCGRFPELDIYYLPVSGHFVAGTQGKFYDWTGSVVTKEKAIPFGEIAEMDPIWYRRLVRDCVL